MTAVNDPVFVERLWLGDGPLTVAVKDSIDIAGVPTRLSSAAFDDTPPAAAHADVVERLLRAGGWRIVGKTGMHELAFGITGVNAWTGTPCNPHWPDRIPGGSSSGSAVAVAAGMSDIALGTDTGGSVRIPAACCGVVGFKPSFGLVSRLGVHPARSSLDCIGVFARSVDLISRAMTVIADGFWPRDTGSVSPRIAMILPPCDEVVREAVSYALGNAAVDLRVSTLPLLDEAFDAGLVLIGAENWSAYGEMADHPLIGEDVRGRLKAGAEHDDQAISRAKAVRARFSEGVDALLIDVDVIALPTLPTLPPTLAEATDARACVPLSRFVRPFNLSGHPAISLPIGTVAGMPVAIQLVGRKGDDSGLLATASAIFMSFQP